MFKKELWTVRAHNGQTYEAIGYEMRGIFGVPVADCVDGEYIDCTVYEIIHGMIPPRDGLHIGLTRPNDTEIRLLAETGWKYDGCWAYPAAH